MDRETAQQVAELRELRRATQAAYVKSSTSLMALEISSEEYKAESKHQQQIQSTLHFISKQILELEAPFRSVTPIPSPSPSPPPPTSHQDSSLSKVAYPEEIPDFRAGCNNTMFLKRFVNILEKFDIPKKVWPAALLKSAKKGSVTYNRIDKAISSKMSWEEAESAFLATFEADAKNALGGLLDDVLYLKAQRKNESVAALAERFELACNEAGLDIANEENQLEGAQGKTKVLLDSCWKLLKRQLVNLCRDYVRDKVMELPEQGLHLSFGELKAQLIAFDQLGQIRNKRTRAPSESEDSRPPSRQRSSTPSTCFLCNRPGHVRADCPQRGGRDSGWSRPD